MQDSFSFLAYILPAFIGIGLAAASGFRVFLPLFMISAASFLGWLPAGEHFEWLSGIPALIATGIAMLIEILAYYIPYVDHLLDTLSIPLATVAGSVLFASQFAELETFPQWALAIIAGGGTAAAISSGFAGTRVASTATTGGLGNSVVATGETAGAGIMTALTLLSPVIAGIMAIVLVIAVVIFGRKMYQRFRKKKTRFR